MTFQIICPIQIYSFLMGNERVVLEKVPKAPQSFSQSKLIDVCGTLCGLFVYLSVRGKVSYSLRGAVLLSLPLPTKHGHSVSLLSQFMLFRWHRGPCLPSCIFLSIAIDLIKGESPRKPTEPADFDKNAQLFSNYPFVKAFTISHFVLCRIAEMKRQSLLVPKIGRWCCLLNLAFVSWAESLTSKPVGPFKLSFRSLSLVGFFETLHRNWWLTKSSNNVYLSMQIGKKFGCQFPCNKKIDAFHESTPI